ncbi:MAG: Asp-tRNA(Asn)/Glu-tRNA(Gln) amidotransferase subunit GatC [Candidatus Sumerlaeia bacterium]|nr:Asp-tRNA(Asn)/Glu-tRNA(Gln) amidotransferase subunit GatC [Candidatus Sumerlaeia bacterium]
MKLSIADVEHVALLARLELSEEEKVQYAGELSRILDYVEQLSELDTSGVEPTAHPLPIRDVFREDEQRPSLSNEEALANAPRREEGCFVVPQIV